MKIMKRLNSAVVVLVATLGCFDTATAQTNTLTVSPSSLTFNSPVGLIPSAQSITIGATAGAVAFVVAPTGAGCSYLAFSSFGGTTAPGAPVTIQLAAQTGSLPAGTYSCTLTFSGSGVPSVDLPVTMNVGSGGGTSGTLTVSPATLSLSAQTGNNPVISNLTITNSSPATAVNYAVTVAATPAGWLQVTPTSGTVPPNNTIQVQANPTGLAAGTYNGTITITPTGSSAISIPVTFTVTGNPTLQIQQNGQAISGINFFYQNGTALPAPQTVAFTSSSSTVALPFSITVNGGSNFLVVSPTGSLATPQNVTFSLASTVTLQNLTAGVYNASVTVSSPNASNPTTTIPVTLTVSNTPLLTQVGSAPSPFNFQTGGTTPANQTIQIGTTSTALALNISTALPSGQNWLVTNLSTTTASASAPATLTIGVNPAGLTSGTYSATITVSSPGVANTITIPVTLNVSNTNLLGETPSQLSFTYQTNAALPAAQTITVTSSGAPLAFTAAVATTSCGNTWLTLNQTSGNTGTGGAPISVSVNPSGITAPQLCSGSVTITSPGSATTLTVPVVLQVSATAIIQVNPSAVNMTGQIGSGITATSTLTLSSSDSFTGLTYTLSSPATWLFVSPTAGTTPVNVQLSANTSDASLKIGANTTTLTLTSPSLQTPITIPVTLNLVSAANLVAAPTSLVFSQPANGTAPAAQTVSLTLSGTGLSTANFTAVANVNFGTWLTVTPTTGTVPGQISIAVNGSNLSQGSYTGSVVVTVPGVGQSPFTIPVTLNVTAPQSLTVSASTLSFSTQIGAAQPPAAQTVQVASAGGVVTFTTGTTFTSCPNFFTVAPTTASTPATLTVSINMANIAAGTCSGSISVTAPGIATQPINVNLTVAAAAIPSLTSIVNGASFIPGAIAPGEIVTIFGSNIGPVTLATYTLNPNNTFATKVSDTEVLFDGVLAPIIFARTDQVAVVVPFEVAGRSITNVQVRRTGVLSNTLQQRVVDTAPGFFTVPSTGSGQGAIVNQNGVVNSAAAPATKGSTISLYITGAGQTSPQGVTGALYGSNPLSIINAPVSVTVDGLPATVAYKGGAPFNIQGLYQINIVVPQTTSVNPVSISVSVGGNPTQGNITLYVQ